MQILLKKYRFYKNHVNCTYNKTTAILYVGGL